MKTELQLAEVARLLFNALGKYATETEKEAARLAFFVFSEQQAKKNAEIRKTCETAFNAVKTAGVYHGAKDAGLVDNNGNWPLHNMLAKAIH
jgi:hypothetical protein